LEISKVAILRPFCVQIRVAVRKMNKDFDFNWAKMWRIWLDQNWKESVPSWVVKLRLKLSFQKIKKINSQNPKNWVSKPSPCSFRKLKKLKISRSKKTFFPIFLNNCVSERISWSFRKLKKNNWKSQTRKNVLEISSSSKSQSLV